MRTEEQNQRQRELRRARESTPEGKAIKAAAIKLWSEQNREHKAEYNRRIMAIKNSTPEAIAARAEREAVLAAEHARRNTPEAVAERKRAQSERAKARYAANPEVAKANALKRYQSNKVTHNLACLKYRAKNPERWKGYHKAHKAVWQRNNRAKVRVYLARYKVKHPDMYRAARRRHDNVPKQRMVKSLRHRLRGFVRGRLGGCVGLCGCTREELVAHIISLFKPGMSMENYGQWHVDHIVPCAAFDLTKPEQRRTCFNWQNLQPLWAADNVAKSDTITHPQLPLAIGMGTTFNRQDLCHT